jgi:hypothetical protein
MVKSPFEKKIDELKRRIDDLEKSCDEMFELQEEEMLRLHRFVAHEAIICAANRCIQTVRTISDQSVKDEVERKSIVDFMSIRSKIDTSDDPLSMATDFQLKCSKKVHELGLQFLNDSL